MRQLGASKETKWSETKQSDFVGGRGGKKRIGGGCSARQKEESAGLSKTGPKTVMNHLNWAGVGP